MVKVVTSLKYKNNMIPTIFLKHGKLGYFWKCSSLPGNLHPSCTHSQFVQRLFGESDVVRKSEIVSLFFIDIPPANLDFLKQFRQFKESPDSTNNIVTGAHGPSKANVDTEITVGSNILVC